MIKPVDLHKPLKRYFGFDQFKHNQEEIIRCLLDKKDVYPSTLSGGQKQRIAIAGIIALRPDVIIFDEPTNGLDVITAKTVTDFLLELKEKGKTVIISTHIFTLIEKLCDRVGILINGKMVACDTLANVCEGLSLEDRFFALYEAEEGGKEALTRLRYAKRAVNKGFQLQLRRRFLPNLANLIHR